MSDSKKHKPDGEPESEDAAADVTPDEEKTASEDAEEIAAPPETAETVETEKDVIAAMLAYVPFLCFYALLFKKDDPFAFHHGKQGAALFLLELIAVLLRWDLIWNLALLSLAAVAIWGIVSIWRGNEFRIPILSDLLDQYQP